MEHKIDSSVLYFYDKKKFAQIVRNICIAALVIWLIPIVYDIYTSDYNSLVDHILIFVLMANIAILYHQQKMDCEDFCHALFRHGDCEIATLTDKWINANTSKPPIDKDSRIFSIDCLLSVGDGSGTATIIGNYDYYSKCWWERNYIGKRERLKGLTIYYWQPLPTKEVEN